MQAPASLQQLLAPLTAAPERVALLLDVDGTLAPIVERPDEASVPEQTRSLLIALAREYGLVVCVSGRQAQRARQIVGIGSIAYVGNHGAELLPPGATAPQPLLEGRQAYRSAPRDSSRGRQSGVDRRGERGAAAGPAVSGGGLGDFAREHFTAQLAALRVRLEDKGAIIALHWRGVPDEQGAETLLADLAQAAEREGWIVHWGRKVLEIRQPGSFDKGLALHRLLERVPEQGGEGAAGAAAGIDAAIYVGDDRTDLDAFSALQSMRASGRLKSALCVAVDSPEAPAELLAAADAVLAGSAAVPGLLAALVAGGAERRVARIGPQRYG